jgi:hypothetical protein
MPATYEEAMAILEDDEPSYELTPWIDNLISKFEAEDMAGDTTDA